MRLDGQEYDIGALDGLDIVGGHIDAVLLLKCNSGLIRGIGRNDIVGRNEAGGNDAADDGAAHVAAADKSDLLVHWNNLILFY